VWVVVGLGNPGRRYRATRHNVGFRVVDRLAEAWRVEFSDDASSSLVARADRHGERVLLVKPQTYMNASGEAALALRHVYRFALERLVVVHDDADLPPGRVRLRSGGRPGGNRGVASLIDSLGEPGFLRVKVGVGRPPEGPVAAGYVLSTPEGEEAVLLAQAEEKAADAVELLLAEGPARAMNRINQKETPHGGPPL
jgi:PTH1 family peptidyl-tRNA hydrolase